MTCSADIECAVIDTDRRGNVFKQVILDLGPPDGTIVIQVNKEEIFKLGRFANFEMFYRPMTLTRDLVMTVTKTKMKKEAFTTKI